MNRWAMATKMLTVPNDNGNTDFTLALQTVQDNTTIPVVVTDSAGNIITYRNLSDEELSEEQMLSILQHMQTDGNKIEIPLEAGENQYLYYLDSQLIDRLAYMPVVILGLVVLFVLFAYVVFSKASKSEQNMVWIGLARESAHQLGTPISALEGWKELLESTDIDRCEVAKEIGDDVKRLGNIAERFSKIGSRTEYDSDDTYYIQPAEILADDYVDMYYDVSAKAATDKNDYDIEYEDTRNSLTGTLAVKDLNDDAILYARVKAYYDNYLNNYTLLY